MITLTDPEGFPVNLMYGQEPAEPGKIPEPLITNYEADKPRVKKFQRFKPGPAAVHKVESFPRFAPSALLKSNRATD